MRPTTSAVILAAGQGKRMGSGPKALARCGDASFLELVASACRGCGTTWVVVRDDDRRTCEAAAELGLPWVTNPQPQMGMFSSVQCGVRTALQLNPGLERVVIFPVDHARVSPETVDAILEIMAEDLSLDWVQPVHLGHRGHPIVVSARVARALLTRPPDSTLREALESTTQEAEEVAVNDPGILKNLNSPADIEEGRPQSAKSDNILLARRAGPRSWTTRNHG